VVTADIVVFNIINMLCEEEFTKWGLEINMSKTKHLAIGAIAQDIKIGGNTIEACMEFKYLGGNVHSYWKQSSRHLQ
jgi:hypothetical protein